MSIPRVFAPFCRYWRLTDKEAHRFWTALVRSQAPQPSQWRRQLLLFRDTHLGTSAYLIDEVSTPATVIEVLESLIHEGKLRAGEARRIEEHILRRTDCHGRWKEQRIGNFDSRDR